MTMLGPILLIALGSNLMQDRAQPRVPPKEHMQELIKTLPPESKMRFALESGRHGDGLYHPWMDRMRQQGVKRATVIFDFVWHGHPVDLKLDRVLYFEKYDSDCAQITDPERLLNIRQSGLEEDLKEFASSETKRSKWFYVDKKPRTKHGQSRVDLADDPWFPTNPPVLGPVERPDDSDLISVVVLDDLGALQTLLKSQRPPAANLDGALFTATMIDDSCMIAALLQAGANPNAQNPEGKTPLMYAAGFGSGSAVRALAGGANAQIRDRAGKSATFFAEQAAHSNIVQLLRR
jgi:hypothetical protein